MKKTMLGVILASFFILNFLVVSANTDYTEQNTHDSLTLIEKSRQVHIDGKVSFFDVKTPAQEVKKRLYIPNVHPARDSVPAEVIARVAERNTLLGKDSLSSADMLYVMRPFLEWAQYIDPHMRVEPQPQLVSYTKKSRKEANNIPMPGFMLLNINDTLIVNRSVDPLFRSGDHIVSINGTPASEYLKYCYDDRYIYSFTLFCNHHYEFITASNLKVNLERDGQMMEVVIEGLRWSEIYHGLIRQKEFRANLCPEARAGYFTIVEFYFNNSLLIKKLRKAILQAKEQGCDSFILDLRGNPGGNGSAFDDLLSIFIDNPTIPYAKGQRLQVSQQTPMITTF